MQRPLSGSKLRARSHAAERGSERPHRTIRVDFLELDQEMPQRISEQCVDHFLDLGIPAPEAVCHIFGTYLLLPGL